MSTLDQNFDVVFGWHGPDSDYSTITATFTPQASITTALQEGQIVEMQSDGTVNRVVGAELIGAGGSAADLADALAAAQQPWLIISGSTEYNFDGLAQTGAVNYAGAPTWEASQVAAIRGTYVYRTTQYVTRSYSPGDTVCISGAGDGGVVDLCSSNARFPQFGEVHEYDSTASTLVVSKT